MMQIVTRKFPEPTKATVTIQDSRYPTGRVLVPVPEVERRKKDLNSIDDRHPLKEVSLSCLKDKESRRPSAQVLCQRLARQKKAVQYQESVRESQRSEEGYQMLKREHDQRVNELVDELARFEAAAASKETELAVKQAQLDEIVLVKDREIQVLRQRLQDKVYNFYSLLIMHG